MTPTDSHPRDYGGRKVVLPVPAPMRMFHGHFRYWVLVVAMVVLVDDDHASRDEVPMLWYLGPDGSVYDPTARFSRVEAFIGDRWVDAQEPWDPDDPRTVPADEDPGTEQLRERLAQLDSEAPPP